MRLFCSVFSNLRSWQDFSILAPPLSDVKFSFLTLRRVEKKGIFFLHQTQKCGCYKILSSSSSFFDFLIIFVTNLQRVKCSSFFKLELLEFPPFDWSKINNSVFSQKLHILRLYWKMSQKDSQNGLEISKMTATHCQHNIMVFRSFKKLGDW